MLNVGKICSRDVDLAEADESVCQAAKRMLSRRVGTLVVVDAERRPKGIVTDRDLTLRVLATNKDPDTAWISEVFTTPVHSNVAALLESEAPHALDGELQLGC